MIQSLQVYGRSLVCNYTPRRWVTAPVTVNHSRYVLFQQGPWNLAALGKSHTFHSVSFHAHTWALVTVSWRSSVRGKGIGRGDKGFVCSTTLTLWFRNQLAKVRKLPSWLHLSTHFQVLSSTFIASTPLPLMSEHSCFVSFVAFLQSFLRITLACHRMAPREAKDVR